MKKELFALGLGVFLLVGCAGTQYRSDGQPKMWYKTDATQQEFAKDKYECSQEAKTPWSGGGSGYIGLAYTIGAAAAAQDTANRTFIMCMEARGYELR